MSERVLGEASSQEGSLEARIKAKAFPASKGGENEIVWLDGEDGVLVLVQQDREERNKKLQAILDEYEPKIIGKQKAGPPSDYMDLWFLVKEFRDKLRELLKS